MMLWTFLFLDSKGGHICEQTERKSEFPQSVADDQERSVRCGFLMDYEMPIINGPSADPKLVIRTLVVCVAKILVVFIDGERKSLSRATFGVLLTLSRV
jgi:hypothetical protein